MLVNRVLPTLSVAFMEKTYNERSVGVKEQTQGGEWEIQQHPWQPAKIQGFKGSKDQTKNRHIFS